MKEKTRKSNPDERTQRTGEEEDPYSGEKNTDRPDFMPDSCDWRNRGILSDQDDQDRRCGGLYKGRSKAGCEEKGYVNNTVAYFLLSKIKQPELLPFIESYDVEINGPNTVTIHINEKKRAGCLLYNGKYVYFDKNGYALESSQKNLMMCLWLQA